MRRSAGVLLFGALASVVGQTPVRAQDAPDPGAEPSGSSAALPSDVIEVIRIKGRAVTGIQTEVPTSIQQFSATDLQELGAQNVSDLAKVTPNVEIKTAGSTAPTFFIRGVGLSDFSANAAGAVAIYRDDVPINAPAIQLTPIFDLENVEVLRGPQATGSGRNASAGAIKMYSRKPTGDLSAELRSSFGNLGAKDFEGAVEAPIVDEMLASRFAFRWTQRDPYVTNGCGNADEAERLPPPPAPGQLGPTQGKRFCNEALFPTLNPRYTVTSPPFPAYDPQGNPRNILISQVPSGLPGKVNDLGNWAARGQLRFQPPGLADMDWLLNFHGSRTDQFSTLGQAMGTRGGYLGSFTSGAGTPPGYQEPDQLKEYIALGAFESPQQQQRAQAQLQENLARRLDLKPYRGDYDRVGQTTLDTWGLALRGDWTIGPATLTSVTGYDTYTRSRGADQDFTPLVLFESVADDDAWQFFQELKLHGELPDLPVQWDVGGYYLMEDLHYQEVTSFQPGALLTTNTRDYTQKLWSWAVYAGLSWEFLDDFTLEAGFRYNWDNKDFNYSVFSSVSPVPKVTIQKLDSSAPTAALTLTYRWNEDVSSYWKYARGWKPGTFNSIAQTIRTVAPAQPETISAWETGLRGTFLDGRFQLGSALFYYKYEDYQVFIVSDVPQSPPTLVIVNADNAEVYGAELDLRLEPLVDLVPAWASGLVISARGGWLQTQFLDFTNQVTRSPSPGAYVTVTLDYSGNQLINSPQFKVSGAAEWTFDLGRWGALKPRYDLAWTSAIAFNANEGRGEPSVFNVDFLPENTAGQEAFWLHNVRLAYRLPAGNIEIAGWCRNVTDKVYKAYAFDASTFSGVVINFVGEPRTYGLDFTVTF